MDLEFTSSKSMKVYKRTIPSNFKEFDESHLLALCYVAVNKFRTGLSAIVLLWRFLKLPPTIFFKLKRVQAEAIFQELQFIADERKVFENWLICKLRSRFSFSFFLGPEGSLEDISTIQLANAEASLVQWQQTKDVKHLHMLAAILYTRITPLRWLLFHLGFVDRLKPLFNAVDPDRNAKYFKRIPEYKLLAVQFNFLGVLHYFEELFPNIPHSGESNPHGWAGLIHNLSGDKLGIVEQVEQRSCFTTLLLLDKIEYDLKSKK